MDDLPRENVFGHAKKVRLLQAALLRLRQKRGSISVLDVGCGNGAAVTRHLGAVADRVLGIDVHDPSIDYAKAHFERGGLHFSKTPIEGVAGIYDAIIFADVLEHVRSPDTFLSVARRLLGPDGIVLVTIPNGYGPFEWESAFSRVPYVGSPSLRLTDTIVAVLNKFIFRGAWSRVVSDASVPYNDESGHVQFFARRAFLRLAAENGLAVVRAWNLSFLSGPYTNYLWAPSKIFCQLNVWIADRLPSSVVSAWLFELRPVEAVQQPR
jgi:SAM-dependent methyltransferase